MEVTRELRLERLSSKKGTAPIRLTFRWDNRRLRLNSGEVCRPADWSAKLGRVKDKPGTYADLINGTLECWTRAATEAHAAARRVGERWEEERMEAEIRVRYQRLQAEAHGTPAEQLPPLPAVATKPLTLLEQLDRWIEFQAGKVSLRNGKPLTKTYIGRLRNLRQVLATFAQQQHYPLRFDTINADFYAKFQHYQLTVLGNQVNTFGGYVKNLKNFLYWCEERELPVTSKFHHFETPEIYVGADFLTEAELRAWAGVDFTTPAARAYLAAHFTPDPAHPGRPGSGRPAVTLEQHAERIELARDKFLQCAYTALRISDADRMAPEHIQDDILRMDAGKTGIRCLIPFFDDEVFKPVALVRKYAPLGLATCLPKLHTLDDYLPHVQHLAGITRIQVTTRVGRKTFVTLKIFQGVPKAQVMLATGHQTEKSFNRYLGVDEQELLTIYRRTARLGS
ncbi:phage integrase SAM-like domain-containing protein [Hymenobacter psychrotolerans]|uniref:Uncharacterized protein n=1 Tax=Hymenobacter psychrotolerans DSM 18569 TaxID=1121959 RepID=A0A1M7F457_9BACT|nr:phage integrase SAM-like domain-containing protein [Hymenobacter psychrotolerans]SHL98852.1 hypothetical protein SAMN02746009_03759 [Hymenobacter psychrotolerans DSM 18569]